jgi:hypothetical protein
MRLKEEIKVKALQSNVLIAKLMLAFNRSERTIQNWFRCSHIILTTPKASNIISEYFGEEDLFEVEEVEA